MGKVATVSTIPAKATQVQILLDIILQILNVLQAIERVFGFDFSGDDE
jgi:hypothetical protein